MRNHLFLLFGFLTLLFASDRLEQTLHQLSRAIVSALNTAHPRSRYIPHVLRYLTGLENRPRYLAEMAYEWCSVICENRQSCEDWESLVFYSLEIGFRHLDPLEGRLWVKLTHTEHHRELAQAVFKHKEDEVVADLLQAWTLGNIYDSNDQVDALLGMCAGYLVDIHNLVPFTRLRQHVINSIALIGYKGFEVVGVGRFVDLLNHLHVDAYEVDLPFMGKWALILVDTIKSPEGARDLSIPSWELLAELASWSPRFRGRIPTYTPQVMASLLETREWDKLECWIGVVWMVWRPETDAMMEDVEHAMISLFRQRPGAVQKLIQWMERWSKWDNKVPEAFQRICKQSRETAQPDAS